MVSEEERNQRWREQAERLLIRHKQELAQNEDCKALTANILRRQFGIRDQSLVNYLISNADISCHWLKEGDHVLKFELNNGIWQLISCWKNSAADYQEQIAAAFRRDGVLREITEQRQTLAELEDFDRRLEGMP